MAWTTGHTLETNCRLHLQMVCVNSRIPNATIQKLLLVTFGVLMVALDTL